MSQNVFGQPQPTEPIHQAAAPAEVASDGRRKLLVFGGAGVGAVALLGAAALLLTSGGDDADVAGEVPAAASAAAAATPAPTATEEPSVALPVLDEVGRNPFRAKIVEQAGAAAGSAAQATDGASGSGSTAAPDPAATGDGSAASSAGAVSSQSFLTVTFRGTNTKTPVKGDYVFELKTPAGDESVTVVAGRPLGESGTAASLKFLGVNSNGAAKVQGSADKPYALLEDTPITLA